MAEVSLRAVLRPRDSPALQANNNNTTTTNNNNERDIQRKIHLAPGARLLISAPCKYRDKQRAGQDAQPRL